MSVDLPKKRRLTILSYANEENKGLHNYIKSMDKFNLSYKILGKGDKWVSFVKSKVKACVEFLETFKSLPDGEDIICVTDCYDLIATCGSDEIINKFLTFDSPIVFGSEKVCIHASCRSPVKIWEALSRKRIVSKNKYINGGFYIGYLSFMKVYLQAVLESELNDDQIAYSVVSNKFFGQVELDDKSELVGNITFFDHKVSYKNDSRNRVKNIDFNTTPCFIHTPLTVTDLYCRMDLYFSHVLGGLYESYSIFDKIQQLGHKAIGHLKNVANNSAMTVLYVGIVFGMFFISTRVFRSTILQVVGPLIFVLAVIFAIVVWYKS